MSRRSRFGNQNAATGKAAVGDHLRAWSAAERRLEGGPRARAGGRARVGGASVAPEGAGLRRPVRRIVAGGLKPGAITRMIERTHERISVYTRRAKDFNGFKPLRIHFRERFQSVGTKVLLVESPLLGFGVPPAARRSGYDTVTFCRPLSRVIALRSRRVHHVRLHLLIAY